MVFGLCAFFDGDIAMNKNEVDKILTKNIDIYKNNIAYELERSHDHYFNGFGFPKYGITSKEYHEQVYFESYVESYTRKLINNILKDISYYESSDEISWPELEYGGVYNGYTNAEYEHEYEQGFGFECINENRKIGYRYSTIKLNEIDKIFEYKNVNEIKIVEWNDEDVPISFCYEDERIHVISVSEFFHDLYDDISDEEFEIIYSCFNEKVSEAVKEVMQMISLTTLPGFTPNYLHKFREEIVSDLQCDVNRLVEFKIYNANYKSTELNSKMLIDTYNLKTIFLEKNLHFALVGTSDYAKSFLTSEYLYRYFKDNPMFDYTPIVSGYLKSIEQLLYAICKNYRNYKHDKVIMQKWTMSKYRDYIIDHDDIINTDLRPAKAIIIECLNSYREESRNHLFHRDYFKKWDRVDFIRNNTLFLYVTLLGMLDESLTDSSPNLLCLLDNGYDNLFKAVDSNKSFYYVVKTNEGVFKDLQKQQRDEGIEYNWNGQIKNTIKFKKFDYDHYVELEISSEKMPLEIWATDAFGNDKELIWKAKH